MRRIRKWFLAGLALTLPTVVTVWLLWRIIASLDNLLDPLEIRILGFDVPGLGFFVVLILLAIAGAIGGNLVGRRLMRFYQMIVERVPLAGKIYRAVQQILEVFVRDNTESFKSVVTFQYPRPGIWAMGFISGSTPPDWVPDETDRCLNVFLPTSPNPTSGFMLMVPQADLRMLPLTVEEALKIIISGGAYIPDEETAEHPAPRPGKGA